MDRATFQFLLHLIGPKLEKAPHKSSRNTVPATKQLLVTIWTMATPDSYRSVCDHFDVEKATAWRSVRKVTKEIYRLAPRFITWPTREKAEQTWTSIENNYGFQKVIGMIDGTHIKIAAPKQYAEAYINRKGYHSMQLQVVCDADMNIVHAYVGQVGSVHAMRVFRLSGLESKCTEESFPENSHLIGDAAYAINKYVMVPYKDNGHLTESERNFNYHLCSARMLIERCIGLLKGRFRSILGILPMRRTDLIPRYLIACCVLHNICLLQNDLIDIPIIVNESSVSIVANESYGRRREGMEKRNAIMNALHVN